MDGVLVDNVYSFQFVKLIKSLNAMRSAQIQVIEVLDPSAKKDVTGLFDKMARSGQFSVVFIKQK